ncbi:hypothetical protein VTJ49DRAFT_6555 [Mycothermus thermophilus]|uniref:Uncharacterized protein n=1 Tax=Humicola insolens TaxID=85995 RepID=A0ABR3VJN3_HUMIN
MPSLSISRLLGFVHCLTVCYAASIQRRQYWQPTPSPEECLDISLTNPTWGILGPTLVLVNASSGGTHGDIRFQTVNTATGESANCTARDIDLDLKGPSAQDVWHNCSSPDLFFQFSLETFEARLKGSWRCGNASSLLFTASGPWETPIVQGCLDEWDTPRGQQTLCIMGGSQVSASLQSPVAIHPQLPLTPFVPWEPARRCVDRSYDPQWYVHGLSYRERAAETSGMVSTVYDLDIDVTNVSGGDRFNCSVTADLATVDQAYRQGTTPWARCSGVAGSFDVALDARYGTLALRQSWECSDGVAGVERSQFHGIAYSNVSLDCMRAPTAENAESALHRYLHSCGLSTAPVTITGYVDRTPTMPHTVYSRSCTIQSITKTTALGLREYRIDAVGAPDGSDDSSAYGTFAVHNPRSGDTYEFDRMPVVPDGGWHDTSSGSNCSGIATIEILATRFYSTGRQKQSFRPRFVRRETTSRHVACPST